MVNPTLIQQMTKGFRCGFPSACFVANPRFLVSGSERNIAWLRKFWALKLERLVSEHQGIPCRVKQPH